MGKFVIWKGLALRAGEWSNPFQSSNGLLSVKCFNSIRDSTLPCVSLLLTCGGLSFWMKRSVMKNPLSVRLNTLANYVLEPIPGPSLLTYGRVPLLLRAFCELLNWCDCSPTGTQGCGQMLNHCDGMKNPFCPLQLLRRFFAALRMTELMLHVTNLIIHGACHGSRPRNDIPHAAYGSRVIPP